MNRLTSLAACLPRLCAAVILGVSTAVPAHANGSVQLPDPGGVTLLSLGLAGLIIGRRVAARKREED